ncbi:MAG: hypothetical protein H7318_16405 [Oligoflexus sp.]|nr:hypothetical protein [Oligoflexus sp.]
MKIAITLTGFPLASDLRAKYLKNEIELDAIAETVSQSPAMGFFDLYSQRMGRVVQNSAQPQNLTLNYMCNLRAVGGGECNSTFCSNQKRRPQMRTPFLNVCE